MNSDKTSSGAPTAGPLADAPNRRRRRLIVGAASIVPSVYTLTSGAQVAVASNLRCMAGQEVDPPRFTAARDDWLRAPVYVGKYDGAPAYCVTSPQELCTDMWNPGQGAMGSEWVVNGSNMTANPSNPVDMSQHGQQFGLIYVNREGTVAVLDPSSAPDTMAVTGSCWASVMGSFNAKLG